MGSLSKKLQDVAVSYAHSNQIQLLGFLGDGNDGAVWESSRNSAVKVLERPDSYQREKQAYLRLQEREIDSIYGFAIPKLVAFDDTRQVIEMTMVFPPFLIDFGKAYVDHPPDFSEEVMEEWTADMEEIFEDRWEIVRTLLSRLRGMGIYYFDARPANIRFE